MPRLKADDGAMAGVRGLLAPKASKTRIVHLTEGGEGFDFLGFHHRLVRGRGLRARHLLFLARWPSRKAMQHARDRLRELTTCSTGTASKRHKQRRAYGWVMVVHQSLDSLGLINLNGTVVAPRPNRDWRDKPNAAR